VYVPDKRNYRLLAEGETMRGDVLARGAKSAQFPSMSHVSQDRWNEIFGERPLNILKPKKKSNGKIPKAPRSS